MPNLDALLAEGWTITLEPSGNLHSPYLATCTRTIERLNHVIYRRAVGTAAGPTIDLALARALAFAETNEATVTEYFTRTEPTTPMPNLLATLGLTQRPTPTGTPLRRL